MNETPGWEAGREARDRLQMPAIVRETLAIREAAALAQELAPAPAAAPSADESLWNRVVELAQERVYQLFRPRLDVDQAVVSKARHALLRARIAGPPAPREGEPALREACQNAEGRSNPYIAPSCGVAFDTYEEMTAHERTVHAENWRRAAAPSEGETA